MVWALLSSKLMISRPSFLKAGDSVIIGTHFFRNSLAETRPPGLPLTQGASWPSLQTFGVMKFTFRVVATFFRSGSRSVRVTGLVDDRVEIDETVVAGRVLVAQRHRLARGFRGLAAVGLVQDRMAAGLAL